MSESRRQAEMMQALLKELDEKERELRAVLDISLRDRPDYGSISQRMCELNAHIRVRAEKLAQAVMTETKPPASAPFSPPSRSNAMSISHDELQRRIRIVFAPKRKPNHHNRDEQSLLNGRWGTCVECPRDGFGMQRPERCINTARSDHNLSIEDD